MKRIITAAALAAALLAGAPRAAAVCPYTVGPLGRYIAPATVQGMTATDDGNAVEVWCTDALDGDDWFFYRGQQNRIEDLQPCKSGDRRQRHPGRLQRRQSY